VRDRVKKLVGRARPTPAAVVIEMGANAGLDLTSAEVLDELITSLHAAGLDVALADVRQPMIRTARRAGLLSTLGEDRTFHTIGEALQAMHGR
jgi:MFS superfamily sulfate permease-like transporter